jgi:putative hydrolase of the HAD superfamily
VSDYRAVIFDLGGVVLPSPFEAWATYEEELGLPVGFIRRVVAGAGDDGAWARHERGEVSFEAFCSAFEEECAAAGGERVSALEVMGRLAGGTGPRPEMVEAVRRIRARGLKAGALTNNWMPLTQQADDGATYAEFGVLRDLFDAVVESSVEGLRKPDPRVYLLVCYRLGVEPGETVFLDDLGMNLKPARELGITTIKVDDPGEALADLEAVLGFSLGPT